MSNHLSNESSPYLLQHADNPVDWFPWGSGGWPMSIFMTPQQKPFYAGTYFPPQPRRGMAGFSDLLLWIAKLWDTDQAGLLESSEDITARISASESRKGDMGEDGGTGIDAHLPELAARAFRESFDSSCGGLGGAPKFPMPHNLLFLILYAKLTDPGVFAMAEKTLVQMRNFIKFSHNFSTHLLRVLTKRGMIALSNKGGKCL